MFSGGIRHRALHKDRIQVGPTEYGCDGGQPQCSQHAKDFEGHAAAVESSCRKTRSVSYKHGGSFASIEDERGAPDIQPSSLGFFVKSGTER